MSQVCVKLNNQLSVCVLQQVRVPASPPSVCLSVMYERVSSDFKSSPCRRSFTSDFTLQLHPFQWQPSIWSPVSRHRTYTHTSTKHTYGWTHKAGMYAHTHTHTLTHCICAGVKRQVGLNVYTHIQTQLAHGHCAVYNTRFNHFNQTALK